MDLEKSQKRRRRTRPACDYCRRKKIRCNGEDGNSSCPNCIDRGQTCVTSRRRNRYGDTTPSPVPAGEILQPKQTSSGPRNIASPRWSPSYELPEHNGISTEIDSDIVVASDSPSQLNEGSSIPPNDQTNWEYHGEGFDLDMSTKLTPLPGPRSYLSICSKPGIRWVTEKTRSVEFAERASDFTSYITGRLKMKADLSLSRMPDPDPNTAWKYTRAYFDVALDANLGILPRQWFEQQLETHLSGAIADTNATWLALRSVVYAAGCRIELSKSESFQAASEHAWKYFENALAVYARLLFFQTSIMEVQALTLMAYYAQNIGTPCLEYILVSDAVRMAFAKGLHRAAPSSQGLKAQELNHRNCLFWAIYCLEKQIASQSGRPSIINDDEITCQLPRTTTLASAFSFAYSHSLIQLSQVLSRVERQLSTARALRTNIGTIVETIGRLDEELRIVRETLEASFGVQLGQKIEHPIKQSQFSPDQLLYLTYVYAGAMLSIHTVLAYPWTRELVGAHRSSIMGSVITKSSDIVAKIARDAILVTEHISPKAYTSVPVAFFGPIYAMISLFVCFLDRPCEPSHLAVLDVATGYFGRLQLATESIIALPFARTLNSLAYGLEVDPVVGSMGSNHLSSCSETNASLAAQDSLWTPSNDGAGFAIDFEDWSTLLHIPPDEDDSRLDSWDCEPGLNLAEF